MTFVKLSKWCLTISAVLCTASVLMLFLWSPRMSIEFAGGTLIEIQIPAGKARADILNTLSTFTRKEGKIENPNVSAIHGVTGDSYLLRLPALSNDDHLALLASLKKDLGTVDELKFTTIGPSVSQSLRTNSFYALVVASFALIVYLAFSFRKLPRRVSPWKFGVIAVIGCLHDVLITLGIFVILSHFTSFEMDTLFITALLTVLAYSANDTIVIFDRIRSAIIQQESREDFALTVERGLRECLTRTVNTTMATTIMLLALFFLGSESIRWFILALIVGVVSGTYSSYLIAAPLLIFWQSNKKDRR